MLSQSECRTPDQSWCRHSIPAALHVAELQLCMTAIGRSYGWSSHDINSEVRELQAFYEPTAVLLFISFVVETETMVLDRL